MASTTKLVELFNADAAVAAAASTTAFVEAAYENLLGLSGAFSNKDERVGFWVGQINTGKVSKADFAAEFLAAAAVKGDILTNAEFAANTEVLAALAKADESTLTTLADVKAAVASSNEASDAIGQTFTLTASGTTGSFDNVSGTAASDTVSGGPGHLETGDVVDGGAGTDTLNARLSSGQTAAPTVSNVENIFVRVDAAGDSTFSMADVTGASAVWADRVTDTDGANEDGLIITGAGLTTDVTLGVKGGASAAADRADVDFVLAGVSGTADVANLVLDSASVSDIVIADVETLNVTTQTAASRVDGTLTAVDATKVTVAGDQNVTLDAINVAQANGYTFDASAATGNVTVTLEDQTAGTLTFTGGAGDDAVYLGTGLDANDVIDGGEGTNTVGVTTAGDLTAATGALLKNFQVFDAAAAAAGTYDMDFIDGGASASTITKVVVSADVAGDTQIDNLAKGANVEVGATTTSDLIIAQKGASAAGSNSDALSFDITASGLADVNVHLLQAANVESITINSTAVTAKTTGHTITDMTFANATSLVLTGDEQLTISGMTGSTAITSIDASSMTDKLIITAAADMTQTGVLLINGGSAADTLFLEENVQAANSVVQGNGGADTIEIADAGANNEAQIVKYAAQSDSTLTAYDTIEGLVVGGGADADDIDISFLGFTGNQANVFSQDANVTVANATSTFTITSTAKSNFFNDAGVDRAVAWASDGTDSVLLIDADKNGDWDDATDMVIYIIGTNFDGTAPVAGDFIFA